MAREDDESRNSREVLERVARDTETVGASSIARMTRRLGDHLSARDALGAGERGETDPIELWGRRIGRGLSVIGFIVLALWLLVQLELI